MGLYVPLASLGLVVGDVGSEIGVTAIGLHQRPVDIVAKFGRAEQLKAKKAISQADFDTAQAAMKSAAAELERATQAAHRCASILRKMFRVNFPIS